MQMAFSIQKCGWKDCYRLLYVPFALGDQSMYCYGCGHCTIFILKKGDD